ncbi:MAG: multiheme c-type cytochrome, partial [Acidobacteriota bacterium]
SHDDELHWTGPNQNWNYMCAECHSTKLEKNYQLEGDRFRTTWSEIDVSCQACHGPGWQHSAWAKEKAGQAAGQGDSMGLEVKLGEDDAVQWVFDSQTGTARRQAPTQSRAEIETCARCHSRRAALSAEYVHGKPLMDTHRPALLEESLYFADGQIRDEVYVYGSFLQSKMHSQGVTCSDCHDPHSLKVHSAGNALCARCHLPAKFDGPSHHFHPTGSEGASCVECHMPARNYMVVDPPATLPGGFLQLGQRGGGTKKPLAPWKRLSQKGSKSPRIEESKSRENPHRILIMAKSNFSELLQTLGLFDPSTL